MAFGFDQIKNPTPAIVNRRVRVATVVISVSLAWISTFSLMGPHKKEVISSILGLVLALINGLAPLYGVDVESKSVPTQDVASIETN